MKMEKRYEVQVCNTMGTMRFVDIPCCRSDDFTKLAQFLRGMYQNQEDEAYQKHTPRIVDRQTKKEYDIFANEKVV